jgi:SAM-dependent methyltransferase
MTSPSLLARMLHSIVARPWIYNLVQRLTGIEETKRRLAIALHSTSGLLLDVGAGTGNYLDLLPPGTRYIWLDNDRQKLAGFRRVHRGQMAILGDAGRIPVKDRSVDYALSVAVSHHLTDAELDNFLQSLARICRHGFIFMDVLDRPDSRVSRLLWKYDRGSFPRTPYVLRTFLERYFKIQSEEYYSVYHHCMLCLAVPQKRPED